MKSKFKDRNNIEDDDSYSNHEYFSLSQKSENEPQLVFQTIQAPQTQIKDTIPRSRSKHFVGSDESSDEENVYRQRAGQFEKYSGKAYSNLDPIQFAREIQQNMEENLKEEMANQEQQHFILQDDAYSRQENLIHSANNYQHRSHKTMQFRENFQNDRDIQFQMPFESNFINKLMNRNRDNLSESLEPVSKSSHQDRKSVGRISNKQSLYFSYSCMSRAMPIYYFSSSIIFLISLVNQAFLIERINGIENQYFTPFFVVVEYVTLFYVLILLLISIKIYLLSIQEGRDLIAFSFIFMLLQRGIVIPACLFMTLTIYFKYEELEKKIEPDKLQFQYVYTTLLNILVINCTGILEVILTSCSFSISQIMQRLQNTNNQPFLIELSNEEMNRGRVDIQAVENSSSLFAIDIAPDHFTRSYKRNDNLLCKGRNSNNIEEQVKILDFGSPNEDHMYRKI